MISKTPLANRVRRDPTASHQERDHRSIAVMKSGRPLVPRVVRQPGEEHAFDSWVGVQPPGQLDGVGLRRSIRTDKVRMPRSVR